MITNLKAAKKHKFDITVVENDLGCEAIIISESVMAHGTRTNESVRN